MRKICLITHCEASHSVEGRVGGWYDSELTPSGKADANLLGQKIINHGFDFNEALVYSSDLKRAVQTIEIIVSNSKAELVLDRRLREMSFGQHEGMSQEDHNKMMQPLSISGDRLDHRICNGAESRREVASRVYSFVEDIMKTKGDKLVVTHGFAASFFIAAFQNIDISSLGYIYYKLNPGSISILEEDDLFMNRSVILLNG